MYLTSLSVVLLLVQNVMLGASNDTSILDTFDALADCDTRKDGVRTEAYIVISP